MNKKEVIEFLIRLNEWRRFDGGGESPAQPSPKEVGKAIDLAIKLLSTADEDGARLDFLESLALADIDEKEVSRLMIFNLWRGTTYDSLRIAIDKAIAG